MNKNMVFTLCNSLLVEPDSLWVTCPLPRQPSASPTTPARATSSSKSASRCMHYWKCNFLPINPYVRVLVGWFAGQSAGLGVSTHLRKNPHKTEFGRLHMRRIYASFSAAYNPQFGNDMSTFATIKWPHIKKITDNIHTCFCFIVAYAAEF